LLGSLDLEMDRAKVCIVDLDNPDLQLPIDDLNEFSMLSHIPVERKAKIIEDASKTNELNRAMGAIVGMAVGDALGHPFEFLPVQEKPGYSFFDLETKVFRNETNKFCLDRGQWTDDAAMGLCMADSFILRQRFEGTDMRVRFWCWWFRGYNNAFRKDRNRTSSVGLGGNIAKSLADCSRLFMNNSPIPPAFEMRTEDSGNGSLMRFAPVPVFMHNAPFEKLCGVARQSSFTTHPGIMAAEACAFFAYLVQRALKLPEGPVNARQFLDEASQAYWNEANLSVKQGWGYDQMKWLVSANPIHSTEKCWRWKDERLEIEQTLRARGHEYNGYPVSAGYFGSYCMDGLALALWSVYTTTNFNDAVVKSINLLGDADSHGSITGQLAGALYGYKSIDPQFIQWLSKWDDHDFAIRALMLHTIGTRDSS